MLLWQSHNHNDTPAATWNEGAWTNLPPLKLAIHFKLKQLEISGMSRDSSVMQQDSFGFFRLFHPSSATSPFSSLLFLPVFSLCPVIIAANQFNLGSEADVLMRMERCWMIPPGHYWWLAITHTANGEPDRQLGCTLWHLQMLTLCISVCVCKLFTLDYVSACVTYLFVHRELNSHSS